MATSAQPHNLTKFLNAMKAIYGPIDTLSPTDATSWTPPSLAEGDRGRYLWTDAFGVLNLLTLGALAPSEGARSAYNTLAARLIVAVHNTLGRTRDDQHRLPGASDEHPMAGGLRIGKEAEEDSPAGDGDGQYHHYLTLWMFALNRMARASGERRYNDLAIELARAIHPAFVKDRDKPRPRMCWKTSVDLQRAVVDSEGNLDPIDGYVVFSLLQRDNAEDTRVLEREVGEYRKILETKWRRYTSDDPLDLGMTLWTAHWFSGRPGEEWATELSRRAFVCLRALIDEEKYFDAPPRFRLAFRELGTCLGVRVQCECHPARSATTATAAGDTLTTSTAAEEKGEKEAAASEEKAYWDRFLEKVEMTWAPSLEKEPPAVKLKLQPITLVMYAAALVPGGGGFVAGVSSY
uniref:Protein-L-isoaspartate O-methyltransferase (Protein L-isoaspartyl methyltransferase) (Protein-beta-aspartate methyltransferase) (PIMT)) n=1 Tax=Ganoderma boninense TaxID=34458 RepID=A0A5K1JV75_9APHY|nr:Protein-L-isoaspartate O-methyltransferase (EC (L-isoaspartyl protein carboxyl methyltransferase) (Protein L-isoaspartyl methyltransferase) (Protein-beta-aspartate methyltransferase) (PIMT) [Ganoderma boninense]